MKGKLLTQRRIIELGRGDEEMPFTKIDAFFEECPWLGKIVSRKEVRQVHVRRIDASLLLYKPDKRDYGLLSPEMYTRRFFFLVKRENFLNLIIPFSERNTGSSES